MSKPSDASVQQLMIRLWAACQALPDFGGDLWARGMEGIQRNRGVDIWLSGFKPAGMVKGETPSAEIFVSQHVG
jgi:hypothetical protein